MLRKHGLVGALFIACVLAIGACVPEKRVIWSPDGRYAAVRIANKLHLCDPNGVLSPALVEGVADMAWLPDSRRLVLVRVETVNHWAAVEALLAPERRGELVCRAPALRDAIIAFRGDWKDFGEGAFEGVPDDERGALLLLVKERFGDELKSQAPTAWENLGQLEAAVHTLQIAELAGAGGIELGDVVLRSLAQLARPTPSPDGRVIAFARRGPEDRSELLVALIRADSRPALVERSTIGGVGWTPDSKRLVYAATARASVGRSDSPTYVIVSRKTVVADDGTIPEQLHGPDCLAIALVNSEPSVSVLPDGGVLFAALETTLPCAPGDWPDHGALYRIPPGDEAACARYSPKRLESEFPKMLGYFSVSPDGRHIAIVDPEDGRLLIYDPRAESVWTVLSADETKSMQMWPAWRSDDELSYAVLRDDTDSATRWDLVLLELDFSARTATRTALSAAWPNAADVDFLYKRKDQPTPATRPATQPASQAAAP